MASPMTSIEQHPDIAALRMRYERAGETLTAHVVDGLSLLAGLYLAASPWVLGFHTTLPGLTMSNFVTGLVFVALAFGLASAHGRLHGVAWVAPAIGVWTVVAPWAIRGEAANITTTIVSNVIVGGLCLLLGLAAVALGMQRMLRR
jgi:hypothetical protein